jgi:hypothetical protein
MKSNKRDPRNLLPVQILATGKIRKQVLRQEARFLRPEGLGRFRVPKLRRDSSGSAAEDRSPSVGMTG